MYYIDVSVWLLLCTLHKKLPIRCCVWHHLCVCVLICYMWVDLCVF